MADTFEAEFYAKMLAEFGPERFEAAKEVLSLMIQNAGCKTITELKARSDKMKEERKRIGDMFDDEEVWKALRYEREAALRDATHRLHEQLWKALCKREAARDPIKRRVIEEYYPETLEE